jgi:HAD superfamily hydrolase (TIGR01484 family)
MQKTLFISDLDGTLLSPDAQISPYTEKTLNELMEKGLNFSVASARGSSVFKLIKNLNIKTPFVLMNGVLIYDPLKKCYIKNEIFAPETCEKIIKIMNSSDAYGHYFSLNQSSDAEDPDFEDEFYDKSKRIRRTAFNRDNNIVCKKNETIFYFSLLDTRKILDPINEALKEFNDETRSTAMLNWTSTRGWSVHWKT